MEEDPPGAFLAAITIPIPTRSMNLLNQNNPLPKYSRDYITNIRLDYKSTFTSQMHPLENEIINQHLLVENRIINRQGM